jgi:predicted O-linked N-acetylglucosamine transferase (SPINDLY family)
LNHSIQADDLHRLALAACQAGRLADGIAYARQALAIDAGRAPTHLLLGMALARSGALAEALASFDRAIAITPDLADIHGNRGDALVALGREVEAVASYDRALALDPGDVETWCNRGGALQDLRRFEEALASYDQAIALRSGFTQMHFNRGNALALLGRNAEAVAAYDRALALDRGYCDALQARGTVLLRLKRFEEAVACFECMRALDPRHPRALSELVNCHLMMCDWQRLSAHVGDLERSVMEGHALASPFILLGLPIGDATLAQATARFVQFEIRKREPQPARKVGQSDRIRLAYLSGDFCRHPVAYLIAGLLERHDRSRFEVIGVSFGPDDRSEIRTRIEHAVDQFHDVRSRSDSEVAALLRELGVDIVIDLTGHTEMSRTSILSYRPAPIQVSYLGFLGTMGADFIDYVIADEIVLPFDRQPFFTEKIVHLPDCFMVSDDRVAATSHLLARSEQGLPAEGFVFSSLNASYKIREPIFAAWMNLLRSVDGSVLWLLVSNEQCVANLCKEAQQRGVNPARLIFAARTGLAEHIARQGLADLFLDTVPYNAGATAMAALWAGVPILTVMGDQWVGRMAASILGAIGLSDLVTSSISEYEALARKLATDPALMASLRARLARNRLTHPLFDTDRFRRHIEAAYHTMWERSRRGEAPEGFRVNPVEADCVFKGSAQQ